MNVMISNLHYHWNRKETAFIYSSSVPRDVATILDKNYETNVSFHKKMNCFYTCPFPLDSLLTKLHRVVSLSFNIDIRGERGLKYSYSESELRIHEFYLNFCCCLYIFCPRLYSEFLIWLGSTYMYGVSLF